MKIRLTNEEKEAIELYKKGEYKVINQLLVSDSNSDISIVRADIDNDSVKIQYDRETLVRDLKVLKVIYELLQKIKFQRKNSGEWAFIRGTNVTEVERFKAEGYIDKCLEATSDKDLAEKEYACIWNVPALMYIRGASDVPYIDFSELENVDVGNNKDILIAPFTKIKSIMNNGDTRANDRIIKTYNVYLESQNLRGMPKEEKQNLYINILGNSDYINIKLNEVIRLEKESQNIYENIRKLEGLSVKTEQDLEKKRFLENYSEYEIKLDEDNLQRLNHEIDELKLQVKTIYEKIKECSEAIATWKKSVTVYVMSEFYDIDVKYQYMNPEEILKNFVEEEEFKDEEVEEDFSFVNEEEDNSCDINSEVENINDNIQESEETDVEPVQEEAIIQEKETIQKEDNSKAIEENSTVEKGLLTSKMGEVLDGVKENENALARIAEYISYLIYKQQSFAKIAGNIGGRYSALNNSFEMKKQLDDLRSLMPQIVDKAEHIYNFEKDSGLEKLEKIAEVNLQVSTLLNYLNNPKSSVGRKKINRFEELAIIEENELKRNIADLLLDIRGEAELRKLRDDLEIIQSKNPLEKIFGIFTGKNKQDEIMIEQIMIREAAIRKTMSRTLRLDYNYSIHELVAEIEMFIRENDDDELVESDVKRLVVIEEELKQNFIIIKEKVREIINQREGRNLPVDEKITREELAELDTQRFLKKYRYDEKEDLSPQVEYQDTTANEIFTIIDYIKTSNILD